MKTGSEREHRGDYAQEADPVRRICGIHRGHETAEVSDVRKTGGGHGLREGAGRERVVGVSPGRPQNFRYQRRPVDECNPRRGGVAQDGGRRG